MGRHEVDRIGTRMPGSHGEIDVTAAQPVSGQDDDLACGQSGNGPVKRRGHCSS